MQAAEATPACWVCGDERARPFRPGVVPPRMTPEDVRITDARYGWTLPLLQCASCGFVYAHPLPADDLVALYADLDDPEYVGGRAYRLQQMQGLLQRIRREAPQARSLLDVGAGSGLLVEAAGEAGLEAVGVEPSARLVAEAVARGLRVEEGVLPHPALSHARFDLVTCIDVIEHVTDPVGLLRAMTAHLAPGGRLVLVTPDVESVAARTLGLRWWHHRLAHVGFLTRQATAEALGRAGLVEVARTRPIWWFGAPYLMARVGALAAGERWSDRVGRVAGRTPLRAVSVPLDLRDSWMILCRSR